MARYTTRDYLGAFAHAGRLLARHRGDLAKVQAELDREKKWAHFRARTGIDADEATMRSEDPPDAATVERLRIVPR